MRCCRGLCNRLCIVALIILFGCAQNTEYPLSKEDINIERWTNEATRKTAMQLKHTKDLYPCGCGGQTAHGIKTLYLAFNYYKNIDMEEGRKLLVTAVDEFVEVVNGDKRMHPYFKDGYPFTAKNVHVAIFLRNQDGSNPASGKLCVLAAQDAILEYRIQDPAATSYRSKEIHSETYEEALSHLGIKR